MRVDAGLMGGLADVPARIRELEAAGFDGAMTAETSHDPFFPLLLAAEHSQRIELMTSIAVAFARSPMTLAQPGARPERVLEGPLHPRARLADRSRTSPSASACPGRTRRRACAS